MIVRNQIGAGAVYQAGTYLGFPYYRRFNPEFDAFITELLRREKITSDLTLICDNREDLFWRTGSAGDQRLLFVMSRGAERKIQFIGPESRLGREAGITEMIRGAKIAVDRREGSFSFSTVIPAESISVFSWAFHPEGCDKTGRKNIPLHDTSEKPSIRHPAPLEL